jgi:hypothetical protein
MKSSKPIVSLEMKVHHEILQRRMGGKVVSGKRQFLVCEGELRNEVPELDKLDVVILMCWMQSRFQRLADAHIVQSPIQRFERSRNLVDVRGPKDGRYGMNIPMPSLDAFTIP